MNTTAKDLQAYYMDPVSGDVQTLKEWRDGRQDPDEYLFLKGVVRNVYGEWVASGDYYESHAAESERFFDRY